MKSLQVVTFALLVCILDILVAVLPVSPSSSGIWRESDGQRPEFVFGKDRELIHASVDLNWLFRKTVNIATWQSLLETLFVRLQRLNTDYDNECTFKEVATELMCEIRECSSPPTPLRCLQIPLSSAHELACAKQRLIVFYIEKESWEASKRTIKARNALSNSKVGKLLNDQYLFMTSVDTHPYATKVLKHMAEHLAQQELLGQLTQMDTRRPLIRNEGAARTLLNSELQRATPRFPVLVVLSPVPAPPPLWNIPWPAFLRRNAAEFEVVGVLPMHATDVSAEDVIQFLHRIVFSPNRRPLAPPKRSKGDDIINSNLADVAVEPGV